MSILLDDKEILAVCGMGYMGERSLLNNQTSNKAQAKKILIQLQAIYNIPDLKAEDVRMGEFIQELQEEVK